MPPRQHLASPTCVWLQLFHRLVQLIVARRTTSRLYQKKSTMPAKNVTGCSKKSSKNASHLQQTNTSAGCIKNCCWCQQKMLPVAAKGIAFVHPSKKTLNLIPVKIVAGASKKCRGLQQKESPLRIQQKTIVRSQQKHPSIPAKIAVGTRCQQKISPVVASSKKHSIDCSKNTHRFQQKTPLVPAKNVAGCSFHLHQSQFSPSSQLP